MKKILSSDSVVALGDSHRLDIAYLLESYLGKSANNILISVGDCGEGFNEDRIDDLSLRDNYKYLEKYNNYLIIARGNHSDPAWFVDDHWANKKYGDRIYFAPDYSLFKINGLSYQIIGGAISIDRKGRTPHAEWWPDEVFKLDESKCQKVDVLITHSAPDFCWPVKFSELVYGWISRDLHLESELIKERQDITKAFHICEPKLHLYGHFHNFGNHEVINNCIHKQLGIDEFWEIPKID